MARENQGLQISLIVFVMLTIILGVTTYLFFRQYEEADLRATTNLTKLNTATKLATDNEADANTLKGMIGVAKTEKVDAITSGTFAEDMKKYGGSYPEDMRFYHTLVEKMGKTIEDKNGSLAQAQAKVAKLEADFAVREAIKQPQIDDLQKARDKAREDLSGELSKFKNDLARTTQQQTELKNNSETAKKEATASLEKIEKKLEQAMIQYNKLREINQILTNQQSQLTAQKFDVAEGQILWINQRTGMAWIDLGRADSLQRQVTFGIYPSNVIDLTVGSRKASIEVTQILGDHLAEGHIFDDKLIDPVMPGDKIFTPVWSPGEKRHFALAGHMELNQSGKDDLPTVINLITMNGGVVDSYIDEKGKRHGEITVKTRYLILGQAPNEKGQPALHDSFSKMLNEAERFGVQKLQIGDLLQRMGWKNQTPVVEYGRGMNPRDFAAKSGEEVQTKSTGSVSDVFKPRVAPARVPTSAY